MTTFDAEDVAKSEGHRQPSDDGNECQEIVFAASCTRHSLEEFTAVENADAVQEHDETSEPNRPGDLRLRGEGADGQSHEQDCSNAEREPTEIDLADEIT